MTLREIYDHYAKFQPDALDAPLTVQIEGEMLSGYKDISSHHYSAQRHGIYFFVHVDVEVTLEMTNDDY